MKTYFANVVLMTCLFLIARRSSAQAGLIKQTVN